jgi:membrane-bound ClpP family serine protease
MDELRKAALELGYSEPISIEPDGSIWLGIDPDRQYLTDEQLKAIKQKAQQNQATKAAARQAVLDKLGLTADEAAALLG